MVPTPGPGLFDSPEPWNLLKSGLWNSCPGLGQDVEPRCPVGRQTWGFRRTGDPTVLEQVLI